LPELDIGWGGLEKVVITEDIGGCGAWMELRVALELWAVEDGK
jgi:hypothetical protein